MNSTKSAVVLPLLVLLALLGTPSMTWSAAADPWPAEKANDWYARQPWLVGCNFLPSTAVNDVEMWQAESYDAATIERELGWARDLGFNTVRVFLNFVVWEADADGLKKRFDQFLAIADKLGIRVMPILFDDCFKPEPRVGKQDNPVPGVHNSQWVHSPGVRRVQDKTCWPMLEKYVKDMIGTFGQDRRVVIWDPYNEPEPRNQPLVVATFRWAREVNPSQPLASVWGAEPISDLINMHTYKTLEATKGDVERAKKSGRPVIITEWMARTRGSRFETHLPYFKEEKIACWSWGLVAGRTQTYFSWEDKPKAGVTEPPVWFHDIFRKDGSPFSPREIRQIKEQTGKAKPVKTLSIVPTAEKEPVKWRYTLEKPADDWFKPGFDDSKWKEGMAPFGAEEVQCNRHPRTEWKSADIWMRREFEMPAGKFDSLNLTMHHDEDADVYIDGVPAGRFPGFNAEYESLEILSGATALLKPGKHVMAVHCHQTTGGQYIDLGIIADE
jgi:hypothetical protein